MDGSAGMRLANLQYTAQADEEKTLAIIAPMLAHACAKGAELVALPECATIITKDHDRLKAEAGDEAGSRGLARLREEAARHGCWLLIGSLLLRADGGGDGMVNRSFLVDPDGAIHARYDKIHLFDADPGDGQDYAESRRYIAGRRAVLAHTPLAPIGMTICYDLRFPALYLQLAKAGAKVLTIPAAFTRTTGEAHWHSLMRARAIETGCFVVAPAQTGVHEGGRETWGHSLVVDPWGRVVSDAGAEPGVAMAEIDLDEVAAARRRIASLSHAREAELEVVGEAPGTKGQAQGVRRGESRG